MGKLTKTQQQEKKQKASAGGAARNATSSARKGNYNNNNNKNNGVGVVFGKMKPSARSEEAERVINLKVEFQQLKEAETAMKNRAELKSALEKTFNGHYHEAVAGKIAEHLTEKYTVATLRIALSQFWSPEGDNGALKCEADAACEFIVNGQTKALPPPAPTPATTATTTTLMTNGQTTSPPTPTPTPATTTTTTITPLIVVTPTPATVSNAPVAAAAAKRAEVDGAGQTKAKGALSAYHKAMFRGASFADIVKMRSDVQCHVCGVKGHYKSDCPSAKAVASGQDPRAVGLPPVLSTGEQKRVMRSARMDAEVCFPYSGVRDAENVLCAVAKFRPTDIACTSAVAEAAYQMIRREAEEFFDGAMNMLTKLVRAQARCKCGMFSSFLHTNRDGVCSNCNSLLPRDEHGKLVKPTFFQVVQTHRQQLQDENKGLKERAIMAEAQRDAALQNEARANVRAEAAEKEADRLMEVVTRLTAERDAELKRRQGAEECAGVHEKATVVIATATKAAEQATVKAQSEVVALRSERDLLRAQLDASKPSAGETSTLVEMIGQRVVQEHANNNKALQEFLSAAESRIFPLASKVEEMQRALTASENRENAMCSTLQKCQQTLALTELELIKARKRGRGGVLTPPTQRCKNRDDAAVAPIPPTPGNGRGGPDTA